MNENLTPEFVPFSVHPRAIKELGEKLVTDDFVAIAELVKNAYDAMATKVIIRFGKNINGDFIEIEDDGDGMSSDILRNVWTQLFTPYKKIIKLQSKKRKRSLSGDKGIGRLSAARLGGELEIYTQVKNSDCYALLLDWSNFTNIDDEDSIGSLTFDDFGVTIEKVISSPFQNGNGTIIRVSNLRRKDWLTNKEAVSHLQQELARIRPPLRKTFDFEIILEHVLVNSGAPTNVVEAYPKFLDTPHYFYSGTVGLDGINGKIKVDKRNINKTEIVELSLDHLFEEGEEFVCGNFSFEFRVWDLDSDSIGEISEEFSLNRRVVRQWIKLNRGVSLYRDEILVLPKTAGVDWLGLEQRRVSRIGDRISTNNIIAFVDITANGNPLLEDTADREMLERNEASEQFQKILMFVIMALENVKAKYKKAKDSTYTFRYLLDNEKAEQSIEGIKNMISKDESREETLKLVEQLRAELKQRDEQLKERLGYYSRLASVGTIASYVVHEVRNSSVAIGACNRDGKELLDKCASDKKPFLVERIETSNKALASLEVLAEAILPLSGAKFQRKTNEFVSLTKIFNNCINANRKVINKRNIEVINLVGDVELAVSEGELFILLQNLVQNSIYWVNKKKDVKGILRLTIKRNDKENLVFLFEDNGPGIDPSFSEAIFLPGVSSKPEGTGMGLTVAAEICEKYKGRIDVVATELGGAAFEINLPRKV